MGPKWFEGTIVHSLARPAQAIPRPQSRVVFLFKLDGALAFFLLSLSFSPAFTI
jgi:hypothetical protein